MGSLSSTGVAPICQLFSSLLAVSLIVSRLVSGAVLIIFILAAVVPPMVVCNVFLGVSRSLLIRRTPRLIAWVIARLTLCLVLTMLVLTVTLLR